MYSGKRFSAAMNYSIKEYTTLLFDCDGVILNSNQFKTDAFYQVALPYGVAVAEALVNYHIANGGISRYLKFAYFLEELVPNYAPNILAPSLEGLLEHYARIALQGLLTCEVTSGLKELKAATPNARWLIVSGSDQDELRYVFAQRGLSELFEVGIYGSPDSKDYILAREINNGNIRKPALFLGDSKYDHQAATTAELDFVFLSEWSEVKDWREWTSEEDIEAKGNITKLLKQL